MSDSGERSTDRPPLSLIPLAPIPHTKENHVQIEAKLRAMGLVLPEAMKGPPGARLPFAPVRVRGNRAYISGHAPLNVDGSLAGPFGKVGGGVSAEEADASARLTRLAILQRPK